MNKIALLIIALALSGCVRKINIEQGNIMTTEMVKKVHIGMALTEVKTIMGSPVMINTFNNNRVDYVYTYKPGGGKMTEQFLTLIFEQDHLKQIKGNMYSHYMQ